MLLETCISCDNFPFACFSGTRSPFPGSVSCIALLLVFNSPCAAFSGHSFKFVLFSLLSPVAGEAKYKDISWFSPNGEKLTPNQQRISVVRNDDFSSTLTIYNANIDDAGIYKCIVSSTEEGDSEATVNVKIFRKRASPRLFSVPPCASMRQD